MRRLPRAARRALTRGHVQVMASRCSGYEIPVFVNAWVRDEGYQYMVRNRDGVWECGCPASAVDGRTCWHQVAAQAVTGWWTP